MRITGTTQGKMSNNPNRGKRHVRRVFEPEMKRPRSRVTRYAVGSMQDIAANVPTNRRVK